MKKKTSVKKVIRQIVREEVAMAINEVITELREPTQVQKVSQPYGLKSQPRQKKEIDQKKHYTSNSVLNEILNETEGLGGGTKPGHEEYPTMGDGTYDSGRMREVMSSQYGDMMNGEQHPDDVVASMGADPDKVDDATKNALTRDYSDLMKVINKKGK